MKKKYAKLGQFALLFVVLTGFTFVSTGMIRSDGELIHAVSAAKNSDVYVSVSDTAFENKLLGFLKEQKVCALTTEQAQQIAAAYGTESKIVTVDGRQVSVLYVKGTPLNKELLETELGLNFDSNCQVVHGNKVIAVVTPTIIS
jgi:hypothetical protein